MTKIIMIIVVRSTMIILCCIIPIIINYISGATTCSRTTPPFICISLLYLYAILKNSSIDF